MGKWIAIGLLVMFVPTTYGQEKVKPKAVTVRLSFSVEEYDPSKPSKAVMKCVVQNDTALGVHVLWATMAAMYRSRPAS